MLQNKSYNVPAVLNVIEQIANKDPDKKAQAKAIELLVKTGDEKYKPLFAKYVSDSSYSVSGASLEGLIKLEPAQAYSLAKKYSNDAKGKLGTVVSKIIMDNNSEDDFNFILDNFKNTPFTQTKIQEMMAFGNYLAKVKNADNVKKGADEIIKLRNQVPEQYRKYVDPAFKQTFNKISTAKKAEGNTELANYIDELLK